MKRFLTVAVCLLASLLFTSCEFDQMGQRTVLQSEIVGSWTWVSYQGSSYAGGEITIDEDGRFVKALYMGWNIPEVVVTMTGVITITTNSVKVDYDDAAYEDYSGKIRHSDIYDQIWYIGETYMAFGKNCRGIFNPLNGNLWK